MRGSLRTTPIAATSTPHLRKTAATSASRPLWTTRTMRSCDSESISSYGVIPVSRIGTFVRSSSIPTPPRAHISNVEDVSPAAPMSWIATTASPSRTSRTASRTSFSTNGSPTCTVGRRCDFRSSKASDAIDAPWIPSRPVFEPA